VESSPAVGADGTVFVGGDDFKLHAIDGVTGEKRWEYLTAGAVSSSPAVAADGTVYVGSDDAKLYAIDGTTGEKRWEFKTGGMVTASPVIGADGTVYVSSFDGRVYALKGDAPPADSPWPMFRQNPRRTGRVTPKLSIVRIGTVLALRWNSGALQSAPTPTGPWQDETGAQTPWTMAPTAAARFFRLKL